MRAPDDLDPARGLIAGALLGIPLWGLILGVLALLLSSVGAHAGPRLEIAAGECAYLQSGVGEWWLGEQYEHASMRARCSQVGVSQLIYSREARRDGWRVAYVDLGRPPLHEVAWGGPGVQPHWTATGYGELTGISAGVLTEWRTRWSPSIEAGLFGYRAQWHASAEHHASGQTNTFSTPALHGLSWYLGAGLAFPIAENVAISVGARYFARLRSHNLEPAGDTVGPKYADVFAFSAGIRIAF